MITAPVGAAAMSLFGPRLLYRSPPEGEVEEVKVHVDSKEIDVKQDTEKIDMKDDKSTQL